MVNLKRFFSLLLFVFGLIMSIYAQNMQITGTVVDSDNMPIIGATVTIKNVSGEGTITDIDGKFSIDVKKGSILFFSYIGMKSQEVTVANSSPLKIKMIPESIDLDEVVVVGYGTQSKRTITSSITKVKGDVLKNLPVNTVGEGLKGKIAGAHLYSSNNTPGSEVSIRIRGGSSVNKSNEPIILVDGIERSFSGINPNDIESIEVLKDAASTAIYGSRASNGVILVTTKKGTQNSSPQIVFEAGLALQQAETSYDLLNAEEYLSIVRPAIANSRNPHYNFTNGYSASSANTDESIYTTRYLKDGESVPLGYKSMKDPLDPSKTLIFQDNNFLEDIYRNALWQNYYIGVSGGTDRIKYSTSAGYTDDKGVALATGYSRLSLRNNIDIKITNRLTFSTGFDYSITNSEDYPNQMNVISRGLTATPTQKKYNSDGLPSKGFNATSPTPLWYEYYNDRSRVDKRLSAFGNFSYQIFDGLKADLQLSTYNQHMRFDSFEKANEFNGLRTTTSEYSELMRNKLDFFLKYSKQIKDNSFSLMLGYSYQKDKNQSFSASVTGGSSDKTPTLSAGPTKKSADSNFYDDVNIGYFGRLTYDYKKKYLFSATFREDASSRFMPGHQWGFFPGASLGWVISDESFMQNLKAINNLKFRLSYGQTGNNSIGIYDAKGKYATNVKYDGFAGIIPSLMPNNNLTWETSTQLDLGFDLSLFNNRLNISADYFDKRTDNLLFSKELPNTSGFSSVQTNIGKVKFYGFDLELSSTNIDTKNFTWTSKLTWSFVKNKVLELPDNGRDRNRIGGITLADGTAFGGIAEGEPLYRYYGYVVDHIIETKEQADNAMYDNMAIGFRPSDGETIAGRKDIGDYEWKNREGSQKKDGKDYIDSQDQFLLGYTMPHSTGGLSNVFTYKNFSLNIYLDWALGHSINHNTEMRYFMNSFQTNMALIDKVKECWKQPGDNTKYAKFVADDPDHNCNFGRTSNVFNYKGDYLCVREIAISYNLPKSIISKAGLENVAITLSGNNLYYFTAVEGVSPEVGTSSTYSGSYYNYPPIRKYSVGIKVTL